MKGILFKNPMHKLNKRLFNTTHSNNVVNRIQDNKDFTKTIDLENNWLDKEMDFEKKHYSRFFKDFLKI